MNLAEPETQPTSEFSMHVVIMAGGLGTRFWPLSRHHRPKQLLSLGGERPLVAETLARFEGWTEVSRRWVVSSEGLSDLMAEALPTLPAEQMILEPTPRNTAPSIALAAALIAKRMGSRDECLGVFPSDHFIRGDKEFQSQVEQAGRVAADGGIVVIGIPPTHPETGYGYIKHEASDSEGVAAVEAFVEKPDKSRALEFLADGTYLWNAGMFFATAGTLLDAFAEHMPELYEKLDAAVEAYEAGAPEFAELFAALPAESFDYGVLERATEVKVLRAAFTWSDVGHWDALPSVLDTDDSGNVTLGDVLAIDCTDSVLIGHDKRLLAAVGLEQLVVVDSEDALLVAPRERAQEVRDVVNRLKGRGGTLT